MSVRRFKVACKLDGADEVTVEITPTAGRSDAIVSVRPKHKRNVYSGLLSDVASIVAARHAKAILAQQGIPVPAPRRGRK
jgi:hypothetical protein